MTKTGLESITQLADNKQSTPHRQYSSHIGSIKLFLSVFVIYIFSICTHYLKIYTKSVNFGIICFPKLRTLAFSFSRVLIAMFGVRMAIKKNKLLWQD